MSIRKTGAVFCPINHNYKGRLLSYQINDMELGRLFTTQSRLPFLKDIQSYIPNLKMIIRKPQRDEHDFLPESDRIDLSRKFERFDFDALLR